MTVEDRGRRFGSFHLPRSSSASSAVERRCDRPEIGGSTPSRSTARWAKRIEPPGLHPGHLRVRVPSALLVEVGLSRPVRSLPRRSFRCRPTAGRVAVNHLIGVRIPASERRFLPRPRGAAVPRGALIRRRCRFDSDRGYTHPRSSAARVTVPHTEDRRFESCRGYVTYDTIAPGGRSRSDFRRWTVAPDLAGSSPVDHPCGRTSTRTDASLNGRCEVRPRPQFGYAPSTAKPNAR